MSYEKENDKGSGMENDMECDKRNYKEIDKLCDRDIDRNTKWIVQTVGKETE